MVIIQITGKTAESSDEAGAPELYDLSADAPSQTSRLVSKYSIWRPIRAPGRPDLLAFRSGQKHALMTASGQDRSSRRHQAVPGFGWPACGGELLADWERLNGDVVLCHTQPREGSCRLAIRSPRAQQDYSLTPELD